MTSSTHHSMAARGITALALAAGLLAAGLLAGSSAAFAHPHVWVGTKTTFVFENGQLLGLRYTWHFDEMYTVSATEGLDTNKDGKLDADELAELLKVNLEGLKEFQYFTEAHLLDKPITFGTPRDARLEVIDVDEAPGPQLVAGPPPTTAEPAPAQRPGVWARFSGWVAGLFSRAPKAPVEAAKAPETKAPEKQKVLTLHMTLPLDAAVPAAQLTAAAKGFHYLLGDSQGYIAFEPMGRDAVVLGPGAPSGCRIAAIEPAMDEQQKKLQEAFGRLGGQMMGSPAKAMQVVCGAP